MEDKAEVKIEPTNGKEEPQKETQSPPPTDFKVAEIWVKSGEIILEAPPTFWTDKIIAIGILEYCKDIVKNPRMQKQENKILPVKGNFLNGIRNLKNKFKR